MKLKNNLKLLNENGGGTTIIETEKSAAPNECDDIGKMRIKKYLREYHQRNKDKIHEQKRRYYQRHKRRIHLKNKKNRSFRSEYNKKYYRINKSKLNCYRAKYLGQRYKTDILFKVKQLLRGRIGEVCKGRGFVKSKTTMRLLGCDWNQFRMYIESLFKVGMSWDNHSRLGWHIDHIIPLVIAKNQQELEELCHYKNLQPLWWYDNLSKGGNIPITNKKA